jgi:ABC-type polysaccharide/polyol phosphate export permease
MSRLPNRKLLDKIDRNLLRELIRAKLKATDYDSIFGLFWSLIGPLLLLVVMYLIFRQRFGQKVYAYPLYLLLGIVCVNFFVASTGHLIRMFLVNRDTMLNVAMHREILVLSEFFIHTYKFLIELTLCCGLSVFYGLFSWKGLLLSLPLILAYLGFVLGIGLALSLVYCFSRDIGHVWGLVTRLLYFVTPVFYTMNSISPLAKKAVYWLNPLTQFTISFHEIFMGKGKINLLIYLHAMFLGAFYFTLGYLLFRLFETKGIERI